MNVNELMHIINQIRFNSHEAELKLRDDYTQGLYHYMCKKFAGVLSNDEINDLISDTWLKVIERIKEPKGRATYHPEKGKFDSYLISEAKFMALGLMKDKYKNMNISIDDENQNTVIDTLAASDEYGTEYTVMAKEEKRIKLQAYKAFLSIVYLCGGHIHQQMAFTYSRLLPGGHEKVYSTLKNQEFKRLYEEVIIDIRTSAVEFSLPADEVIKSIEPLRKRMSFSLSELFVDDKNRADIYSSLLDRKAEDTCFGDYFVSQGGEPITEAIKLSKTVSGWLDKLDGRVRVILGARDARDKEFARESGIVKHGAIDYEKIKFEATGCSSCRLVKISDCR